MIIENKTLGLIGAYETFCEDCIIRLGKCRGYDWQLADTCRSCKKFDKLDAIKLLSYYYNTDTNYNIENIKNIEKFDRYKHGENKGKSTEQNEKTIKRVLQLHMQGLTINAIAKKLNLQFRTVKNIVNGTFANENANIKVETIRKQIQGNA